jgi:hypothetical protein
MPYDIILVPEAVADLHQLHATIRSIARAALAAHLRAKRGIRLEDLPEEA